MVWLMLLQKCPLIQDSPVLYRVVALLARWVFNRGHCIVRHEQQINTEFVSYADDQSSKGHTRNPCCLLKISQRWFMQCCHGRNDCKLPIWAAGYPNFFFRSINSLFSHDWCPLLEPGWCLCRRTLARIPDQTAPRPGPLALPLDPSASVQCGFVHPRAKR